MNNNDSTRKSKTITGYCVSTNDLTLFQSLIASSTDVELTIIENQLRLLHASKFLRLLMRSRPGGAKQDTIEMQWSEQEAEIWLNGQRIGTIVRLFKRIQPYEAQSNIAYDVFYQRFYEFLAGDYHSTLSKLGKGDRQNIKNLVWCKTK